MKRVILILLSAVLLAALMILPVMAADGGSAAVSSATGASGDTVKVTLSLSGFANADQLGVVITWDEGLTWEKTASSWLVDGTLEDIGFQGRNQAAWATSDLIDLNKDVLELAFTIPQPAQGQTDFDYDVKCVVTVMADGTTIGTVEATGKVTMHNPAQTVILDKNTLELDLKGGTTDTVTAYVLPANTTQSAQWTSNNTAVAEVVNGVITARSCGTARITVTVGSVTNYCDVTVTCSHNLTEHPAVTPTCQSTGNNKYYTCDICSAVLKADKATVTTVAAETLGMKDHDYNTAWLSNADTHWKKCATCTATTTPADHSYSWVVDKPATEDVTGIKHEVCQCGAKRSEDTEIPKLDHVHVGITHHAAVKATCVKAGTVEHWTCSSSKCAGKYYGDNACQLELQTVVEAINKDNHTGDTELKAVVEPTCSEAGYSGDTYCTSCNGLLKKGAAVAATGKHTPKAGYLTDANQHWQICSHCSVAVESTKAAHSYKWVVDKKATESETGLKHQECVCGFKTAENTVVDKLKHAPKLVEGKAPTCTEDGVADHYYCGNCGRYYASTDGKVGDKIDKASIVLAATGHSFSQEWQSDGKGHYHACACGEIADQAEHTTEVVNAKEATATETGYTGDTVCTVCQYEVSKGEEIPVLSTEAPTEPEATEPEATEPVDGEEDKGGISPAVWIVPVVIAAAAAIIIPIWKKRKA